MGQTVESYSVARRSWQSSQPTSMGEAPMEIDAVYGDKGKKGKHVKGKKGKDRGKGKHKGKQESSPKFEGCCRHCAKWGHKQRDCRYKNTVAEVDEERTVESPNNSNASSTNLSPTSTSWFEFVCNLASNIGDDLNSEGRSCTLWMALRTRHRCKRNELAGSEFVELLVGTGATEHVCGPLDFTHVELTSGPRPALKTATGELLKHYGQGEADFRFQSEELRVSFTVVDVKRPIRHPNVHPSWQADVASIRRCRSCTHTSNVKSFPVRWCWPLWMRSQR